MHMWVMPCLSCFSFLFQFNKQINTRQHSDACIGTFCEMRMGVLCIDREQVVIDHRGMI